jgi:hypothetical protein
MYKNILISSYKKIHFFCALGEARIFGCHGGCSSCDTSRPDLWTPQAVLSPHLLWEPLWRGPPCSVWAAAGKVSRNGVCSGCLSTLSGQRSGLLGSVSCVWFLPAIWCLKILSWLSTHWDVRESGALWLWGRPVLLSKSIQVAVTEVHRLDDFSLSRDKGGGM